MEGIRRIGVTLKALGFVWLLALLFAAGYNAVGDEIPISDQDKAAIYESDTGNNLEAEAEAHTSWPTGKPDPLLALIEAMPAREKLLAEHFAKRPLVYRRHEWNAAMLCIGFALVGYAVLAIFGWIVTGFAMKRA
ncbi:hypothetical protein [Caballeronia sp. dw_276]|uniref:hypothetical protein n=1 Tax=Caballeronia sp. dw_276 TaxID=2719795 RepID=UPI001BD1CA6F|nr:hypothetical protein [Caballeronia sp. dw_276]